jgi:ribosome-associated translation inhibitor RaiA
MQEALQITYRNVDASEWIDRRIREEVGKLERYYPRIHGCRVLLERAHRRHESGNRFRVRIDLALPGEDIHVSRDPDQHGALKDNEVARPAKQLELGPERKDVAAAIDDAFETARRRLQDFARRQRGDTKIHEPNVP